MSLFNPTESPAVTVRFSDGNKHYISENSMQTGILMSFPSSITVINNKKQIQDLFLKLVMELKQMKIGKKKKNSQIQKVLNL